MTKKDSPMEKPLEKRLGEATLSVTLEELNTIYRAGAAKGWAKGYKARIQYIDDVNAYYGAGPEEPENPWEDYTTGALPLSLD